MSGPPEMALFFGRLHPLMVHLPIGFIVLLALLELLARKTRFKQANANAGFILALAVPVALFAVVCGWLLSLGGGYQDATLSWHKWTGIGTASLCLVAGLLYSLDLKKPYRWALAANLLLLVIASHFGGSLTHGSDYLVRYAPAPLRGLLGGKSETPAPATKPATAGEVKVFTGVIQPLLQKDCVSCHGPEKSKAKLRLDSYAALLKGGESGPAIVPGKSGDSSMVKRLLLPPGHDDHMPPDGKPQPSADDIALLQWWVDAGAPSDKTVSDLKPPANVARILDTRFGSVTYSIKAAPSRPLGEILPLASSLADELAISITALSSQEPWLQCNASVAGTNFGDAELGKLKTLGANLRWLDLGGTRVTDNGLAQLVALPNLTRLHLERTAITDAGLAGLAVLPSLEYLNLYGDEITDAGVEQLRQFPKLKQVYLWKTKVTPAAAKALAEAHTDAAQIQAWNNEIESLKKRVREAHFSAELGVSLSTASSTNSAAVNTVCPVSGKPVNPTKTVQYEGKLVAFCCDDCKAKFEQDPKPYLDKLASLTGDSSAKPASSAK